MSAIIILTIGPVQGYISQARRTQDLWQGSRILSYLASQGVHHAAAQPEAEVIYPYIQSGETDNIPNRIVVRWNGTDQGARNCAAGMEKAIRGAWLKLSENTRDFVLTGELARTGAGTIWEEQESTWLECYWVVAPENPDSYSNTMHQANNLLGARKMLRNFPQIRERDRKCSITGEHGVLGDEQFWKTVRGRQRNLAILSEHERLSAISTIKRFAHERRADNTHLQFAKRFPSTSSIAAAPFKYDVLRALDGQLGGDTAKRDSLRRTLKDFIQALLGLFQKPADLFFSDGGDPNPEYFGLIENTISQNTLKQELIQQFRSIDGDFLFEDTLISKTIEEYSGNPPEKRQMAAVLQSFSALLKAATALNIPKPQPYLVILSMDGDHMGKTLGDLGDKQQHSSFSRTLAAFARNDVKRIVEEQYIGRVVYAGGDDVLALLPVRGALQVAEELRKRFSEVIDDAQIMNCNKEAIHLTVSTGLACIHHTHNLQDAVHAASHAQKNAKNQYGRDAVAVEFLRRSGEPRSMGHKWQVNSVPTLELVSALVDSFSDELARSLPYDVAQIAYSMTGGSVPAAAVQNELYRVLNRRLDIPDHKQRKTRAEELANLITELVHSPGGNTERAWQNAQHWLELARFIAQKEGDV
ncbi:MAG: type III-B CRISPR-associated protein Cas10/Cmr2 [Anaerolineae bacterium]|nr:type III-B CRISPR-associated protein Cas10/Cmr2 [Anaerolineae bacterium]